MVAFGVHCFLGRCRTHATLGPTHTLSVHTALAINFPFTRLLPSTYIVQPLCKVGLVGVYKLQSISYEQKTIDDFKARAVEGRPNLLIPSSTTQPPLSTRDDSDEPSTYGQWTAPNVL